MERRQPQAHIRQRVAVLFWISFARAASVAQALHWRLAKRLVGESQRQKRSGPVLQAPPRVRSGLELPTCGFWAAVLPPPGVEAAGGEAPAQRWPRSGRKRRQRSWCCEECRPPLGRRKARVDGFHGGRRSPASLLLDGFVRDSCHLAIPVRPAFSEGVRAQVLVFEMLRHSFSPTVVARVLRLVLV